MQLEVFISTLENQLKNISCKTRKFKKLTVINQKPHLLNNEKEYLNIEGIRWVNIDQIGLSRSRNIAIETAEAKFVYFTDDDIVLMDNFTENVLTSFKENSDADILAFHIEGIEQEFKEYNKNKTDINSLVVHKN